MGNFSDAPLESMLSMARPAGFSNVLHVFNKWFSAASDWACHGLPQITNLNYELKHAIFTKQNPNESSEPNRMLNFKAPFIWVNYNHSLLPLVRHHLPRFKGKALAMFDLTIGLGGTCFPFSSALMALLKTMTLGVRSLAETDAMAGRDDDDDYYNGDDNYYCLVYM